ncbi:MAG TPA: cytochrome P450 [Nocardioidaceae bacterium]|nr:cytochrome P450 [Nocardioidaceae bacterium]
MTATTTLVSSASIFAGCTAADIDLVVRAVTGQRHVAEGEAVCEENDHADRWWIVVDGLADVTVGGLYVGSIGPGETIGELALLDGEPRAATVTAVTSMELLEVRGDGFLDALRSSPSLALAILREVTTRLRVAHRVPSVPRQRGSTEEVPVAVSPPVAAGPTVFDPRTPEFTKDPYVHLAAVRETAPVTWSEAISSYVVTRYDDVHRLARTRTLTGSAMTLEPPSEKRIPGYFMMIMRDGDNHTRLRRLMSGVFTPKAVSKWRERADAIVHDLLEAAEGRAELDVIADYAMPLPAQLIAEMLGLPQADTPRLREWTRSLITGLETFRSEAQHQASDEAGRGMVEYLDEAIQDKRKRPDDGLLSAMLQAEESGTMLDDREVRAQVMMLYIAGHETTMNLIGNGLTHLFRFPDQLERLRANPGLDQNAVEEMLRFDSPVQLTRRVATEPVEIGDQVLEVGSHITLCLGAANRDPRRWGPTSDVLDVGRLGANEHVAFGGGSHYCLGASLARIEATLAIPSLIRRFPAMAPAYDEPKWGQRTALRGLDSMPVSLR